MKATRFEFRHREEIIGVLFGIGLAAFWSFPVGSATGRTTWLVLSSWIGNTGALTLGPATLFVTIIALLCGIAGTALRVWATAHLGATTMTGREMLACEVIASGPYRYLRNPLYAGLWLFSVPIFLLMPIAGAVFVLLLLSFFLLRVMGGEEAHLSEKLGEPYRSYRATVPRIFPRGTVALPKSDVRPRWAQAVAGEAFPVCFTACFALLAWRYNAQLLMRCLLICFGVSLIVKALMKRRQSE